MRTAFLSLAFSGLLVAILAVRPPRIPTVAVPVFFAGWLTSELASWLGVTHLVGTSVMLMLLPSGSLTDPLILSGIGATIVTAALLAGMIRKARRVPAILEAALAPVLGTVTVVEAFRWRRLALPFLMGRRDVTRVRNLQYAGKGRRKRLDVWHHRDMPTGRPCLIQIHGSGWMVSNKDHQGKPVVLEMASRGWVCFAINYPLSPRATWPDHIVACKQAIAWVRENAHSFGGDPSFIAVTGGSAGGHLSSLCATTQNDPMFQPGFEDADTSVQTCVPLYGVYDLTASGSKEWSTGARWMDRETVRMFERVVAKRKSKDHPDVFRDASPLHRAAKDVPPFFVIHGTHDTLVPVQQARAFVEKLGTVSSEAVVYAELDGAHHAFDVFWSIRSVHTMRSIALFLEWAHSRAAVTPEQAPTSANRG